jgi:hypothetical protein
MSSFFLSGWLVQAHQSRQANCEEIEPFSSRTQIKQCLRVNGSSTNARPANRVATSWLLYCASLDRALALVDRIASHVATLFAERLSVRADEPLEGGSRQARSFLINSSRNALLTTIKHGLSTYSFYVQSKPFRSLFVPGLKRPGKNSKPS